MYVGILCMHANCACDNATDVHKFVQLMGLGSTPFWMLTWISLWCPVTAIHCCAMKSHVRLTFFFHRLVMGVSWSQAISWVLWAKAAIVPGLVSLVALPLFLRIVYPPMMSDTKAAQKLVCLADYLNGRSVFVSERVSRPGSRTNANVND